MTNNTRPLGPLPNHSTVHLRAYTGPAVTTFTGFQSPEPAAPSEHGVYARLDAQAAQIKQLMGELAALRRYVTRIEQQLQARSRP